MKLVARTFKHPYHPAIFMGSHQEWREGFILARLGTKLLGFIMGKRVGKQVRMLLFAVYPQYRDQGIGSHLLACFEREVARLEVSRIFLEVRISNSVGIRFYKHHGFVETGYIPSFYSNGEGAVVMAKDLNT